MSRGVYGLGRVMFGGKPSTEPYRFSDKVFHPFSIEQSVLTACGRSLGGRVGYKWVTRVWTNSLGLRYYSKKVLSFFFSIFLFYHLFHKIIIEI